MKSFSKFINEAPIQPNGKSVVVTFGRFTVITSGHEKLANKVYSVAKKKKATPIIFTSSTFDSKKNPVKFNDKVKFLKKAFPKVNISRDSEHKNLFAVAAQLSDDGVTDFTLVVGSDRVAEFKKSLGKYVGITTGNYRLNFDKFEVISAGNRDPDADGVEGMSASKLRELAASGKKDKFISGLAKNLKSIGDTVYNTVRKGLNIK